MEFIAVKSEPRVLDRKKGAKVVRKQGLVPCVLYGGEEIIHFSVHPLSMREVIYTPDFKLVEIEMEGGKKLKCIVKDVQYHPVTDAIMHIDFLQLVDDKKIKIEVPVVFKGVAPGIKSGGKLYQKLRRIKIMALPADLVDKLTLDISMLKMGQSVRVRDIETADGIDILNNEGIPVASIEIPRALRNVPEDEEEEEEGTEGEEGEGDAEGGEEKAAE